MQRGFVFREPAKQMNRSDIFSQAVVEQDSNYELDSFCVESDDLNEESTWIEPSVEQLPARTRRAQQAKETHSKRPNPISGNNRRRKRIVFQDSSSDDEGDGTQPPAKKVANTPAKENQIGLLPKENTQPMIVIQENISPERKIIPPAPTAPHHPNRLEEKKLDFRLPAVVPTTSRSVVVPPSPSRSGSSSCHVSSDSRHHSSADFSNPTTSSSPPRTLLVSSRQVATTTQVISSLQVRHGARTHVCSFDVADFVVSSQLGVIRKLHSGI